MATITDNSAASSTDRPGTTVNSHPFTCVTCAIAFRSSKMQRDHMRSDWHRYNLKRRVASLPPLTSEVFAEKVLSAQASTTAAAAKAAFEKTCTACQKTYYSENAYQNHLGSQRHRTKEAAMEKNQGIGLDTPSVLSSTISLGEPIEISAPENVEDAEVEAEFAEVISGMKNTGLNDSSAASSRRPSRPHHSAQTSQSEDVPSPSATPSSNATATSTAMPLNRCLFCNYDSPSFKLSILHMSRHHALFIPEQAYLTDLEGLVRYLQDKIVENHECLFCHKLRGSVSGIQTHMRDKGHTMIAFDSEEEMVEIGQFYDFSSTYSDEEEISDEDEAMEDSPQPARAKLGARREERAEVQDEEEEGWETDSDSSGAEDQEMTDQDSSDKGDKPRKLALTRYEKERRAQNGSLRGGNHRHAAYTDGAELHLPSGRIAGHRNLARYYRQNLHSYPTADERLVQQRLLAASAANAEGTDGANVTAQARQLARRPVSELGMVGVTDARRRQLTAITQKQQNIGERQEQKYRLNVEKRANNQKHFRDDNFGIRL